MKKNEVLKIIKAWMEASILNQKQISEEESIFSEWNKGYLDCLLDLKDIICPED